MTRETIVCGFWTPGDTGFTLERALISVAEIAVSRRVGMVDGNLEAPVLYDMLRGGRDRAVLRGDCVPFVRGKCPVEPTPTTLASSSVKLDIGGGQVEFFGGRFNPEGLAEVDYCQPTPVQNFVNGLRSWFCLERSSREFALILVRLAQGAADSTLWWLDSLDCLAVPRPEAWPFAEQAKVIRRMVAASGRRVRVVDLPTDQEGRILTSEEISRDLLCCIESTNFNLPA